MTFRVMPPTLLYRQTVEGVRIFYNMVSDPYIARFITVSFFMVVVPLPLLPQAIPPIAIDGLSPPEG